VLATLLADAGITVKGKAVAHAVSETERTTLAAIRSDRLDQMLIAMLAFSNNYMADMLTLDIAAARGYDSLSLPYASEPLKQIADRAMLETYPERASKTAAPHLTSGSGLSVNSRLSARHVIALLSYMYRQSALFPAFYGAIPAPISSAASTIEDGDDQWLDRIVAKTGTLTEPVSVRSLAGYFRLQDGGFGAFAVIVNGTSTRPRIGLRDTVAAYQEDIEAILAEH
jgi:D-alanyl-D-alanine carboxypeptidase/D-alanyl-D-alanine-endopeptidase (penicillin-binding protein 4)